MMTDLNLFPNLSVSLSHAHSLSLPLHLSFLAFLCIQIYSFRSALSTRLEPSWLAVPRYAFSPECCEELSSLGFHHIASKIIILYFVE